MPHTTRELQSIQQNFLQELKDAHHGKITSFPFIKHRLSAKPIVKEGETFQVIVIGGSIFQKAFVQKQGEKIKIVEKAQKSQPPFKTKTDFDKFIEKEISPKISSVTLNFAYSLKPVFKKNRLDGILISGTKENIFENMVGKRVGEEIEKIIDKKRKQKINIAVANDTICLLLAGLTAHPWDELAAGVVGTGMNFALFLNGNLVVNLESANFDKFPQSKEAKLIDAQSTNRGRGAFEKEVSGAYLFKHFNLITGQTIQSTKELDKIASVSKSEDSKIARDLLKNSAQLVACQVGGIMEFERKSLTFVIEGSLFWKSRGYKQNVQKTLAQICPNYKAKFVKIPDSTILGAAKLIA